MKKKELTEMRSKEKSQLVEIIERKRKEAIDAYGKMKAGREKNLKKRKGLRRDIAQLLGIVEAKVSQEKEVNK